VGCLLAPDVLGALVAAQGGRLTPGGAEVLIDYRGACRRTAMVISPPSER
jgi:hypothetical protein